MIFALVDCNNFYVACEQLFQPRLLGRPVVVLSNNDGCVVSRSAEAKALGIAMGAPWHTVQALARRHQVVAFSSNYALYADMSARVMRFLSASSPRQEVYSIDECFLDLAGTQPNPTACAHHLRTEIKHRIGLPVCVGLGATKTLAKLANHLAKKRPHFGGVCSLQELPAEEVENLLASVAVDEVWGVGARLATRLQALGIATAGDLKRASPAHIRARFSVTLARTVCELNGEICHGLLAGPGERRQILSSRSFAQLLDDREPLEEAVVAHATRAAEKLRQQQLLAGSVGVLLRTNPFRTDLPQQQGGCSLPLAATDDTRHIARMALQALRSLYRPGFAYQKTGVILSGLVARTDCQPSLFAPGEDRGRSRALMAAVDRINRSMGRGTIRLLAEGTDARWAMRAGNRTPRYTTRIDELPVACAGSPAFRPLFS